MKNYFSFLFFLLLCLGVVAQDVCHKDDEQFIDWAINATLKPGYVNISDPSLGKADYGDVSNSLHKADGKIVSLGDGGEVVVSFSSPIVNGKGADFAVFENAGKFGEDPFLELAFVEVSSNGKDFFRFPSVSLIPTDKQTGSFEGTNPALITNLAGKDLTFYGTPFDLDDLKGIPELDLENITHVKLVDVVGSIDKSYASYDSKGNIINDPFPTPFNSSGFDLDAVGVIHNKVSEDAPPVVKKPIEDIVVDEDSADKTIDLSACFSDPDGDPITYSIKSNTDEGLVEATIDKSLLTLEFTEGKSGVLVLTIEATANGKSVEAMFSITIHAVDHAPVVVKSIEDVVVDENAEDKIIDLGACFSDADGDPITYSIISNTDEGLLKATINRSSLALEFVEGRSGVAVLTIEAIANGKIVEASFNVTVVKSPVGPVLMNEIEDLIVNQGSDDVVIELSSVFACEDGDMVFSVAKNSNPQVVESEIHGEELVLSFVSEGIGEADLTIRAEANEQSEEASFSVTVNPITGIDNLEIGQVNLSPNPCGDYFWLEMDNYKGDVFVSVLNLIGHEVMKKQIKNFSPERFDMAGLPSGMYLIRLHTSKGVLIKKVLKK
ncbi:MAG: T9SS type A sorting domain-containing protein [Marinifilaceae bacterium]